MDLKELQRLFPKWKWDISKIDDHIECLSEYFTERYYPDTHDKMINIYNSVDYVVAFLLENGFNCITEYVNHYNNKTFDITVLITTHLYFCYYDNDYEKYLADGLIKRIKELLDIEIPFKRVQND